LVININPGRSRELTSGKGCFDPMVIMLAGRITSTEKSKSRIEAATIPFVLYRVDILLSMQMF
jgi:hypothetical protein